MPVICGTNEEQMEQVGNAVPPILARALAEHFGGILLESNDQGEGNAAASIEPAGHGQARVGPARRSNAQGPP